MNFRLLAALSVLGAISLAVLMTGRRLPVAEIKSDATALSTLHATHPMTTELPAKVTTLSSTTSEIDSRNLPAPVTELTSSLHSLHSISVRSFESMPMFGANRASFSRRSYSDYELPARHLPSLFEVGGDWRDESFHRVRDTRNMDAIEGYEAWSWLYAMHRITSRGFVYREIDLQLKDYRRKNNDANATFIVGLPAESGSLDLDEGCLKLDVASPLKSSDRMWKLELMQLISILKHDPPVAYVKQPPVAPQGRRRLDTRNLDDIELTSLNRLRTGENHVITWNANRSQIHMVAAIRAKNDCLKCHEGKKFDDLMGAFIYRLVEPEVGG